LGVLEKVPVVVEEEQDETEGNVLEGERDNRGGEEEEAEAMVWKISWEEWWWLFRSCEVSRSLLSTGNMSFASCTVRRCVEGPVGCFAVLCQCRVDLTLSSKLFHFRWALRVSAFGIATEAEGKAVEGESLCWVTRDEESWWGRDWGDGKEAEEKEAEAGEAEAGGGIEEEEKGSYVSWNMCDVTSEERRFPALHIAAW
jgi:hypothetical protein